MRSASSAEWFNVWRSTFVLSQHSRMATPGVQSAAPPLRIERSKETGACGWFALSSGWFAARLEYEFEFDWPGLIHLNPRTDPVNVILAKSNLKNPKAIPCSICILGQS